MVQVRWVTEAGVESREPEELPRLLRRDDGMVWVDMLASEAACAPTLTEVFGFHAMAVRDCVERNHVPKTHVYADHLFVVLHSPEHGRGGHVHYVELDQFVSERYLVTVHGPANPLVPAEALTRQTAGAERRLQAGHLRPQSPYELSYSIVSALTRHQAEFVAGLAREAGQLEQRVMEGQLGDPQAFLEELFGVRQELLAVRTMAGHANQIYQRIIRQGVRLPPEVRVLMEDTADQFGRVHSICSGQMEFVRGVIEFYQARADTKLALASERLTLLVAMTLPITALASVYGMNLIVYSGTQTVQLVIVLVIMVLFSAVLFQLAKRQGWW